ncbi:hypothetical protein BN903_45 [Halorubrum sp. AJ67]|nr:hypothetical protein BN903_45 [Halorubrum sp. AJ67]
MWATESRIESNRALSRIQAGQVVDDSAWVCRRLSDVQIDRFLAPISSTIWLFNHYL